jgi:hypothetical protein
VKEIVIVVVSGCSRETVGEWNSGGINGYWVSVGNEWC